MLEQVVEKLSRAPERASGLRERRDGDPSSRSRSARVELIRHLALPLPFADSTFDAVCATRGTEESGRRAKVKGKPVFTSLLEVDGLHDIAITSWWKLFDRARARKNGESNPVGANVKKLSEALLCGVCGQVEWGREASALMCRHCGKVLSATAEGIVLN